MKRFSTFAALVAVAVLLTFLAAPWFALRNVQAAARDGDVHALFELIDYDAVRAGLRAQLATASAVPAPKVWDDPLGALSRAMRTPPSPAQVVDARLTPAALHALIGDPQMLPKLRHWGPSRVRFAVGPRRETLLTLQRRGFVRWQVVQLRFPGLGQKAGAPAAAPPQ